MKKRLLLLIFFVLLALTSCKTNPGGNTDYVTVFSDGSTDYTFVTAQGASEEARELANRLADLSGAYPEVITDVVSESSHEVIIGDTNRPATEELVKKLQAEATATTFHYIIAEDDGNIVILSDDDIGYIYALSYIKETYIKDGVFSVPKGVCDIRHILWDDYYASDIYYDRLVAEADKNHYEDGKEQLGNEINRYENNKENTIMTVEQVIEQYKKTAAAFNTADFGEYSEAIFTNANSYRTPTVYPVEGSHPRVLFNESSISDVRANITADESSAAYKKYIALSEAVCDGKFKTVTGNMTDNWDASLVAKIEAKAFRYAMTGEKIYGYEAIIAAKNAMLTINVPHTYPDWCRTYGYLMYVNACVYDWCYDLMTEEDKAQMVAGCVNLLGMHLEIVCYISSANKVPIAQGTMYGHGAEDQLLVDYLSFAIACYDEAPEIYELVAGRILNDYVEAQNYLFESGSPWEGAMYGAGGRSGATLMANILFARMKEGGTAPFTAKLEDAIVTTTYYMRPDNQPFRIGDINENRATYNNIGYGVNTFLAANFYKNAYLKDFSYDILQNFTYFSNGVAALSSIQFLAINDPEVSHVYTGEVPLTRNVTWPHTSIFARSANEDTDAFAIYMTMPENFAASHAHMECGSFQIFYKGALASDSGHYSSWGGTHHMGYNMQTVASNSLLIYNPALAERVNSYRPNMIYSGGQSIVKSGELPTTLEALRNHDRLDQCTSLGVANVEKDGVYLYSYMGGDMTNAYDAVTASEVTRYMFAVATGDKNCPLVFLTFDRITALDESFHKAALIHVQEQPEITKDGFAVITNTNSTAHGQNNGKMIVQSVGFGTEYTVIGGEGKEFWIAGVDENGNYSLEAGKNLDSGYKLVENSIAEYGWGRIEISPAEAALTNHMLTVMYVTDADNNSAPVKAKDITSENLAGAMIFGKAVLFSKNEKLLTEDSSFTLTEGAECFVAGVSAGTWTVMNGNTVVETVAVADGTNLLTFTASGAGTYTIKLAK